MDIDQHPYLHKDQPSECRSFSSNYRACSQPRKISRGILIDSSAKFRSKYTKKEVLVQSEEYLTPAKADPAGVGNRVEAVNSTDSGKHPESVVQEAFPSLSTRSFHQRKPISEVVHGPTESNCNENSMRQSDSMNTARKDSNAVGMEKLSIANAQEVDIEDTTKKAETRGRETLRMKLWEILRTVASPKQHLNDYDLVVGAKDLESPQEKNGEHNPAIKFKQNSDTIESDSEFPIDTVIRPMTHSLCKKRASNKLRENRTRNARSTYYMDIKGKNTACFREGFSARISHGIHGGSLMENQCKKQGSSEACKTFSPVQGNQGENQWVRNHREVIPPGKRSLAHGNEGGNNSEFYSRRKTVLMEPKNIDLQREPQQFPLIKLSDKLRSVIGSSKLQENVMREEDVGFSFLKSTTNEKVDAKSPTFEMKTPTKISSPGFSPAEIKTPTESYSDGSPPKGQPGGPDDCSPGGMIFNKKGIQCFKSWLDGKSNCYLSNSQIKSDDAGENDDTPSMNPRPMVEEEPRTRMSRSSSQDSDSEEDSQVKGVEVHSKFQQHLELKQERGLPREVALFAMTLKRFKSKMNSVARKRSAEILMSVTEKINSQLQNAEYQMQADVGKLTNHNKSKRKHLEMRYQELQGNLKAMHERFKEEVNEHLQLCKSTVEGLEAQQMELKVAAEKQRASNRKRLLQAEAAIESELNDAQRKITMIQNSARQKMLLLKNIVADCLKEGNFSRHKFYQWELADIVRDWTKMLKYHLREQN